MANILFGRDYGLTIFSIKESQCAAFNQSGKHDIESSGRNSQEHKCNLECKRLGCLHYAKGIKQPKASDKLSSFSTWNTHDEIIPKIAHTSNQAQANDLMLDICDRFSFSDDVVEERSPHMLPYTRSEFPIICNTFPFSRSKLRCAKSEFAKCHSTKKLLKLPDRALTSPQNKTHQPIDNTESLQTGCIDKSTGTDSFLYRVNSPNYVKSFMSCDSVPLQNIQKASFGDIKTKKVDHTWDEYVLNILSKSTANLILKDFTSPSRQELLSDRMKGGDPLTNDGVSSEDNLVNDISNCEDKVFDFKESKVYLVDSNSSIKIRPALQDVFPCSPSLWSKEKLSNSNRRVVKGMKKWQKHSNTVQKKIKNRNVSQLESKESNVINDNIIEEYMTEKSQQFILNIVDEWISKWLLEKKWQKKELPELLEGTESINDQERLGAVSAIGRAIVMKRNDKNTDENPSSEDQIAERLIEMLNDSCPRVALAAAVTLFGIDRGDEKVTQLLIRFVKHGETGERWIAVQCLAKYEHHNDCIIMELLSHVKGTDCMKAKKSQRLLKHISYFTMSIQYMLAEQLNSTNWKDRITACKILPMLNGTLSRDIANKLSYLMWNDWNRDVRLAAANALGRSGNGKLVHDALCKYLQGTDEQKIIAALKKVCAFGFVTNRLYSLLSSCLASPVNTVCLQTIKTIIQIKLCDPIISSILVDLVSSERNFKIKTNAIKALGIVGDKSQPIRDCLMWALHFEKNHSMRLEACVAITKLQLHDEEMVKVLRELLVVEENERLKRQVGLVLHSFGLQPTGDDTMSKSIQTNVQQLCGKNNVLARMLLDSEAFKTFLHKEKQDDEINDEMKRVVRSENAASNSGAVERGFDATLEAYRIRNSTKVNIEFPDIEPPFIPYWSESNESIVIKPST